MTNTLTATSTDGRVRTAGDVRVLCSAADLINTAQHRWAGVGVVVQCWPTLAFQVAVYALDAESGDHRWSAIFDYEAPAALITAAIETARTGA